MDYFKFIFFCLFFNLSVFAADPKPLPSLPLWDAADVVSGDSLIFVNTSQSNLAHRLYLYDLINLPVFSSSSYVLGKPLTGFSSTTGTITSSDTVLTAFDKLYGNLQAINTAAISVGTFDSQSEDAKGIKLLSNVLYAQSASATAPGMMNTGTQSLAGVKTFTSTISGNISGNAGGNAATATALASNPTDCASDTYATTIAASGNLTCSAVSDAGLAVSYLKADGSRGLSGSWNAGAFNITASSFIGALTGNASTASALASNPSDCASDTYATTIAANGNLTCTTVTDTGLATSYLKADGSRGLSGNWNAGAFSITATTFVGALTGNASTATALASNPSDCSSNNFATTIAANGDLTCAQPSAANLSNGVTGSGAVVLATSPTLVTPTLGAALATSLNGMGVSCSATTCTFQIVSGKSFVVSNSLQLSGTDGSNVDFGTGGTVAYTANKLSVFAATTSAELAGVISNETGSGALVFGTSPTITTPTIAKLANLTTNGYVKTSSSDGTLSVQTTPLPVADTTPANQAATTCSTARTIDWTLGNNFTLTLTNGSTCALTWSGAVSGQTICIDLSQASSGGGTALVSFATTTLKPTAGAAYVMTTGNSATDTICVKYNGTDYRLVAQQNFL